VLEHGTGGLNIDGCRVDTNGEDRSARYNGKPALGGCGGVNYAGKMSEVWDAPSGRWPANLIHDGSDEVVALTGEQARFFYCAKASKRDRNEGLEGFEAKATAFGNQAQAELKRGNLCHDDGKSGMNKVKMRQNTHPTVKPTDLMRYLCRLVTPPNGVVLDPFMGSGSTGKAAMLEGFQFIGIERDAEYMEIAKARIEAATIKDNPSPQLDLLENV
jgi:site-specific DNA-methyltransferase (adenine-specific)